MICAVVVNSLATEIAVFINIPSGVVNIPFAAKAVTDITAFNFLVTHTAAVPKPQIPDNENRAG